MENILNKIKKCKKGSQVKVTFEYDGEKQVVEGGITSISQQKKQISIETDTDEWEIDFKDIVDIEGSKIEAKQEYAPKKESAPQLSQYGYCILALFFGHLGVHNFYIGKVGCATIQLLAPIIAPFVAGAIAGRSAHNPLYAMLLGSKAGLLSEAIVAVIISIWILIDIGATYHDASGVPLRPSVKSVQVCFRLICLQLILSIIWAITLAAAMS